MMSDTALRSAQPPLILIGTHRSGTSLLARVLERQGLFIGWRQQPRHHEAAYFQALNQWLLREAGGSWSSTDAVAKLLGSQQFCSVAVDYLRSSLGSLSAMSFLGPRRWLRARSFDGLNEPWGWKDPRTTVTLPLWLEVFPDARVLHIRRHGIDVAASLHARNELLLERLPIHLQRRRWRNQLGPPREPWAMTARLDSLDGAFDLWREYEEAARRSTADLGEQLLMIRYEDLLGEPVKNLEQIQRFYPLIEPLTDAAEEFDAKRAFAYRRDPELAAAAERHQATLTRFGY